MQPEQIDTFLDLCETRSFNRTAERLGVTQSTVSGRVAALERFIGVQLFRRSRAGTELTTEGLRFEPHARALRHTIAEARAAARGSDGQAMMLRLGLQNDLAMGDPARWVRMIHTLLPQAGLYIEADYSAQMCRDVQGGLLDLALIFTPHPSPDLHFESLGELSYRMVAPPGEGLERLEAVTTDRYVLANLSPAFVRSHDALLPGLATPPLAAGQGAIVQGLILAMRVAGYLEERIAARLVAGGSAVPVAGAPVLTQPIYAALHYRNRHRTVWRKLLKTLRQNPGAQEDP
ncbi:MAG: LysR family transcriptional regulator [Pararhodobacter sp.]|nr:LysR family transcriptional regulator [Pararhodobacter sp.]